MIGIDFGASYVDAVVLEGGKLRKAYSIPQADYDERFLLNIIRKELGNGHGVSITGIRAGKVAAVRKRSAGLKALEKKVKVREFGEMAAIAEGAKFLTGKKRLVVVNVGTGTPFILVDGKKYSHIAGTGIGGGTLEGLGRLLLSADVSEIEEIAGEGHLDLTIGDLIGKRFGKLPGNVTASNFGRAARETAFNREEIASSVIKLVAESLGVMGILAARSQKSSEIVFTGRVVEENALVRKRIAEAVRLFGGKAIFPKNGKYCTAIGAAILGERDQ
ncbi:MAG: hypothetical protein ABIG96_02720 [Candidatus Micrarchaeota archaeon]